MIFNIIYNGKYVGRIFKVYKNIEFDSKCSSLGECYLQYTYIFLTVAKRKTKQEKEHLTNKFRVPF